MLVWVDTETTGLEPDALLLELALVVTDDDLNTLTSKNWVIHHQQHVVERRLNDWTRAQHGQSGLLAEIQETRQLTPTVEKEAHTLLSEILGDEVGKVPMCGSTVSFDRGKIEFWMPELAKLFHYRNVDVSSVKEVVKRWAPELELPPKGDVHRAMPDILDSIKLLAFFREQVFKV